MKLSSSRSPSIALFMRANLPILPFGLLEVWLGGIVFVFGIIRSAIVSCAGIAIFAMAGLRAAPMMPIHGLLLGGLSSIALLPSLSLGVSTMYISYDEVAV